VAERAEVDRLHAEVEKRPGSDDGQPLRPEASVAERGAHVERVVEVPHLGSVEVQPIPRRLQRVIQAKAAKGGRIDHVELMVQKLVYGCKDPDFSEAEVRQIIGRWTLRVLQPILDRIDQLSGTDEHLRLCADQPPAARAHTKLITMEIAWLRRFPHVVPRRLDRRLGCGGRPAARRVSTGSSSRGSPGDSEPEPPGHRSGRPAELLLERHEPGCRRARCRAVSYYPNGPWERPEKEDAMRGVDLQDMPYSGDISKPGAWLGASDPCCSRCGTPLGGRRSRWSASLAPRSTSTAAAAAVGGS
jgi:hypothetical protein